MAKENWTAEGPDDKGGYILRDGTGEVRGKYANAEKGIYHHVDALQHIDELRALFDLPEREHPKQAVLESLVWAAHFLREKGELQHGASITIDRFVNRARKLLCPKREEPAPDPLIALLEHCEWNEQQAHTLEEELGKLVRSQPSLLAPLDIGVKREKEMFSEAHQRRVKWTTWVARLRKLLADAGRSPK